MNVIAWPAVAACMVLPLALTAQQPDSVTITGSVTTSYTYGTHALGDSILVGRAYDRRQNSMMINVANLTLERVAATDHVAAGFRLEAWLGPNAGVVKSNGLDLGPNADIWQAYAVLNLPLSDGRYLQFKSGKIATLMGVEVGEDVLNPNWGIGYQDIFLEPFTETGVELDAKLSPKWDAELRLTNGWDQVVDLNKGKSVMGRLGLTPDVGTLIALVAYAGPEQPINDRNVRAGANLVAAHRLSSAVNAQVQLDYGQEDHAAPGGAQARWCAAGAWVTYDVVAGATLAVRGDYMNDRDGSRTSGVLGFPVNAGLHVGSMTTTLNIKRWDHALLRPEARFDRASLPVFDSRSGQLSLGLALSYVF